MKYVFNYFAVYMFCTVLKGYYVRVYHCSLNYSHNRHFIFSWASSFLFRKLCSALVLKSTLFLLILPYNKGYFVFWVVVWWKCSFRYKRILVIISHSQDFLNGVCTNIIHLDKKHLKYYTVRMSYFT